MPTCSGAAQVFGCLPELLFRSPSSTQTLRVVAVDIAAIDSKPDILHVLRVKLARRNAKLGSSTFGFVQNTVDTTLNLIDDSIRRQWPETIKRDTITVPPVPLYKVSDQLLLKNSHSILDNTWGRSQKAFTYSITPYTPPSSARVVLAERKLPEASIFTRTEDILFCLVDFELWVEECLSSWLAANMSTSSASSSLAGLMQKYYAMAKKKYQSRVEQMSVMLLTLFELWVALDSIVSTIHPLLYAYPPEFSVELFEPLLLRNRTELERLSKIEHHIRSRQSRCPSNNPSLSADPSPEYFAVRFYDQSSDLQNSRTRVEQDAHQAWRAKFQMWERKKRDFDILMKQVEEMECGIFTPRRVDRHGKQYVGRPRHDKFCRKCAKEKSAKNIDISKHEWPLPEDETMCKAVIFELVPPESIVSWRDATFFLLHDMGRDRNITGLPSKQVLLSYVPLEKCVQRKNRRVTLTSSVKPVIQLHYL
ncbi:uncharacterized protein Z519_00902 [Cladophialophora bantiana CBS 173.52]|uniref:Uncharacterized protein n=1 Tax=Cladophialophora bantiana (strain ATCC 10958 / CBS 173.52 / CDC B-1940 / NIH 8579) TaxID=1442370 RepID=A0A0D2IR68_CLAB1|nr:uncharacterized protein Z519_00902 [Cladophialophora bantiana CBS 173.52]KIW99239.1 hypothetical protein Z519_00902 [Cladophialophora bantiana CBS 173.52]